MTTSNITKAKPSALNCNKALNSKINRMLCLLLSLLFSYSSVTSRSGIPQNRNIHTTGHCSAKDT